MRDQAIELYRQSMLRNFFYAPPQGSGICKSCKQPQSSKSTICFYTGAMMQSVISCPLYKEELNG